MDADAEAASRRRAREGDEDEDRRQRSRREDKELAGSSAAFGEATANQPAGGDASDSEEERMELLAMARKAAKESSATAEPEERERAKGDLEQPTRVLYAVARGKGAFTKDDMMKEISSQLPNDCLMSYLYRGEDAAKTVFVLQPLASDVAAILAYDWRLIEVLTHDQIMTRGSFLSGFADISILRVPSSAFPREQDATGNKHGVKFTSELFMDEAAKVVVRSVIQGAKNRVIKEQSQEDGVLASLGPEIAAAWRDANSEEFTIENVEKERYFCRGKVSKVTENVLIAFKLGGGLAGAAREGVCTAPHTCMSARMCTSTHEAHATVAPDARVDSCTPPPPVSPRVLSPRAPTDRQAPDHDGQGCLLLQVPRPGDGDARCGGAGCDGGDGDARSGASRSLRRGQGWWRGWHVRPVHRPEPDLHCLYAILPLPRDHASRAGGMHGVAEEAEAASQQEAGGEQQPRGASDSARGAQRQGLRLARARAQLWRLRAVAERGRVLARDPRVCHIGRDICARGARVTRDARERGRETLSTVWHRARREWRRRWPLGLRTFTGS